MFKLTIQSFRLSTASPPSFVFGVSLCDDHSVGLSSLDLFGVSVWCLFATIRFVFFFVTTLPDTNPLRLVFSFTHSTLALAHLPGTVIERYVSIHLACLCCLPPSIVHLASLYVTATTNGLASLCNCRHQSFRFIRLCVMTIPSFWLTQTLASLDRWPHHPLLIELGARNTSATRRRPKELRARRPTGKRFPVRLLRPTSLDFRLMVQLSSSSKQL